MGCLPTLRSTFGGRHCGLTSGGTCQVRGEGFANYDFQFAINWSINKKVSFAMLKGIAVDLEPNVNIELDKGTARQKFYLTGELPWPPNFENPEVPMTFSWTPPGDKVAQPPKLKFNVIATVGALIAIAGAVPRGSNDAPATAAEPELEEVPEAA